jgi:hypothetical protein
MNILQAVATIVDYDSAFGAGAYSEDFGEPIEFPFGDLRDLYDEFLDEARAATERNQRAVGAAM